MGQTDGRWRKMAATAVFFIKNTPLSQLRGKLRPEPKDCRVSLPLILFCKHMKSGYSHPVRVLRLCTWTRAFCFSVM